MGPGLRRRSPAARPQAQPEPARAAGLYYQPGSLKARLCREGRQRLYAYCRARGVPHRQLGKLIVACTEAEVQKLQAYQRNGHANGTPLDWLEAAEAQRLEPALHCTAALWSPTTGIVDAHGCAWPALSCATAASVLRWG